MSDRWQAGADLCAAHCIPTSRMSVWRLYRAHFLQSRRDRAPPVAPVPDEETDQLLDQVRHLVALRAVENLHQPHLPPCVLISLVQNKNRRLQGQLVRDTFDEQLNTKRNLAHRDRLQAIDNAARACARMPFQMKTYRIFFKTLSKASNAGRKPSLIHPQP